jgi:transcriptional regulator with XRE-family HTH domain
VSDLGEILRSAREKKKATLLDAAAATRIQSTYLEALEQGDYAILPGPAYVTGFLRNYARYLGLHPDDVIQEYRDERPPPMPSVKAATRVLANGHQRQHRARILWTLGALVLLLAGGFAIKQYNDTYAHPYAPLNVTPANLGSPDPALPARHASAQMLRVKLRPITPVWVRVTVDGKRVYEGILRPRMPLNLRRWAAHHAIYVATLDGAHLRATFDGHPEGILSTRPGLIVDAATPAGWQRVS